MGRQAVILAGGGGTRLGEITRDTPKPLLQVDGQPFITLLIEELRRFGFDDLVILVGGYRTEFERALHRRPISQARVKLVTEPKPAGTAGALIYAAEFLRSRFLLMNGDSFFDINLLPLVIGNNPGSWLARVALCHSQDTGRYGTVGLSHGRITDFGEKSGFGPGLINAGIYWMKREILNEIGTGPSSIETDVLPGLASRGMLRGRVFDGNFIDIGLPDDLARGRRLISEWRRRPAVFLDRDGVLNRDHGYVHRREDFEWIHGAKKAIRLLNDRGYLVFVVTNQAGVARGYYEMAHVERLHRWMNAELRKSGAHIDRYYICPHHPDFDGECDCRKPRPGMLLRAMDDWTVDPSRSFLVGDKVTDLQAAEHARIAGHIFESGDLYDTVSQIIATRPAERGQSS